MHLKNTTINFYFQRRKELELDADAKALYTFCHERRKHTLYF